MSSTVLRQRAVGCIVGSAVGDALGAPFEFRSPGEYSAAFPQPMIGGIGEMIGNRTWEPGQFTDDTEMGVMVAESLIACGGVDVDDQLLRFRAWVGDAKDVGNLTREVLGSSLPGTEAAYEVMRRRRGRSTAGNGSIMRAAAGAVYFASDGTQTTMAAGRLMSAVTHADPLSVWASRDAARAHPRRVGRRRSGRRVPSVVAMLPDDVRAVYEPLLSPTWTPKDGGPGNGSAMGAFAQAVWAMRTFDNFADVVTAVIDLGDDADSVAAVAGALAGAKYGVQSIPSRWLTYVHGQVRGVDGTIRHYDHLALQALAVSLMGETVRGEAADDPPLEPREVLPGLWATNRSGLSMAPEDCAVISLCRINELMRRPIRREVYLVDQGDDHNASLPMVIDDVLDSIDAFLDEGRTVVVHCHAGQSRTGLILIAHMMRRGLSLADAKAMVIEAWPHVQFLNESFGAELERRDRG